MNHILESTYLFITGLEKIFIEKIWVIVLFAALVVILLVFQTVVRMRFKSKQLQYPRVRDAVSKKGTLVMETFSKSGVEYPPMRILMRIFKEERILELWASSKKRGPFIHIRDYEINSIQLNPGPKRQNDGRIPEGFYYVDRFNPLSKYHLSLGLNYPNECDRTFGVRGTYSGDICIQGGTTVDGCIPVTDDYIKELYIIAVEAVRSGQDRIPVHIFPRRLNEKDYNDLKKTYNGDYRLISFWDNIKEGFDEFEHSHVPPKITVSADGKYIFNK